VLTYPARLEEDVGGGFVVTFRDIPEAITQGANHAEALERAKDALITAMDFYIEDGREVPAPSEALDGEALVELPVSVEVKVKLLNEMVRQRLRPTDLARAMAIKPQEVTRIMDLHHATKIDTLARAFHAMNRRLDVQLA
jgi:antitoxin HicB